jgi:epoxyqueuosine reductase
VGERAFGCDVCQDVCPWNERFASETGDASVAARPANVAPDLAALLTLSESQFEERFGDTAVARAGRRGLARNAAVALGNRGGSAARAALERAEREDPEPLVRAHAAWALGPRPAGAER